MCISSPAVQVAAAKNLINFIELFHNQLLTLFDVSSTSVNPPFISGKAVTKAKEKIKEPQQHLQTYTLLLLKIQHCYLRK